MFFHACLYVICLDLHALFFMPCFLCLDLLFPILLMLDPRASMSHTVCLYLDLSFPCVWLDPYVSMHVLCSYAYVHAFTCLYAWFCVLPCFHAYIHMLRCTFTCLHAYFHVQLHAHAWVLLASVSSILQHNEAINIRSKSTFIPCGHHLWFAFLLVCLW